MLSIIVRLLLLHFDGFSLKLARIRCLEAGSCIRDMLLLLLLDLYRAVDTVFPLIPVDLLDGLLNLGDINHWLLV